jgi:hypothetical protein
MANDIHKLIGLEVEVLHIAYPIDLILSDHENRNRTNVWLRIEEIFTVTIGDESHEIDSSQIAAVAPALQLLHTVITDAQLSDENELFLEFDRSITLSVKPSGDYEAWELHGSGVPNIQAP